VPGRSTNGRSTNGMSNDGMSNDGKFNGGRLENGRPRNGEGYMVSERGGPHDWQTRIAAEIATTTANFARLAAQTPSIAEVAEAKIMLCGNGGSVADAQQLAAEAVGRYRKDRAPLAVRVDTSAQTATENDCAFEEVFARQITGLGRRGDLLLALSTSGDTANVLAAVAGATANGITTIALTGAGGAGLAPLADRAIRVPAARSNAVQELHITIGHILCGIVEDALC
jgi:D-sedoheptulose 7-phosphate isomerase